MDKIKEIFKSWNIALDPNEEQTQLAIKRLEICNSCEHKTTTLGINQCSVCGCALRGKVYSPVKGACPKGKWNEIDNVMLNEKIFVQIASYRDPELVPTIRDCIAKAKHPERLTFGICWQHSEEDTWDNLDEFKDDVRFKILDINYKDSKGACWARNELQQLYNGEDYTLQLDSHHRFIQDWDEELIKMYKDLQQKGHEKPLITSYLPSYFPEIDPQGRTQEVWKMDFNRFTPEGYIFTFPSLINNWENLKEPIPARFYSAHFAFTTGSFCIEVQHDPNMYFHGEEPSIAVRAFTHGYDLFHPHRIIAWHEYTREGKKKHWDDNTEWPSLDKNSHTRYRLMHEMDGYTCTPCAKNSLGKYYFGDKRTLQDYELYVGVRFKDRKVQQYTLDGNTPPNPTFHTEEEYEKSLLSKFKHCIDIHKSHFQEKDYDFWVIAFEKHSGEVLARLDADEQELNQLLKTEGEWIQIWKEYDGEKPDKWVVWPHSKSKGYIERLEQDLT